jgi:hypothetical protein
MQEKFRSSVSGIMMATSSMTPAVSPITMATLPVIATTAATTVFSGAAEAGTARRDNEKGTNTLITFKPGYEQYADLFASKENAAILANAMIKAERSRRSGGGSPDDNRPNSSKYEQALTNALKKLNISGAKLSKIATIKTEEAEAQHLCGTRKGDGRIAIRFTTSPEGQAEGGKRYMADLSARVSAAGRDSEFGAVNFAKSRSSGCTMQP